MHLILILFVPTIFCHENSNPLLGKENDDHVHEIEANHKPIVKARMRKSKIMEDEGDHAHEHIKQHLDGKIKANEEMTNDEIRFHFFKTHDLDNNDLLDGIELFKAVSHRSNLNHQNNFSEITLIVDNVLKEDINDDGYLSYPEFSSTDR